MGLTRKKSEINAERKGRTVGGQQNKPDINAERKGRTVGGQQKNQSLKGAFLAAAETAPFKICLAMKLCYNSTISKTA